MCGRQKLYAVWRKLRRCANGAPYNLAAQPRRRDFSKNIDACASDKMQQRTYL